jgi:hypothetical protein
MYLLRYLSWIFNHYPKEMIYIIDGIEIEAVNIKVAKSKYKKETGRQAIRAKPKDMNKPKESGYTQTSNFNEYELEKLMRQQGLIP